MLEQWPQLPGAPGGYGLAAWLFLKLLGVVYLCAFLSLMGQVRGLAGRHGILPVGAILRQHASLAGRRRAWLHWPTLCWYRSDDRFLVAHCVAGAILSILLMLGVAPVLLLVLLWALYLSLTTACTIFLSYQWDALLLEMGFLAIWIAPLTLWVGGPAAAAEPPPLGILLLHWLLFRLMFSSGWVKLLSGNPVWRRLEALDYHYWTQPLPSRWAWYVHHLPRPFHRVATLLALAIECVLPLLIFLPGPCPGIAAGGFLLLMGLIHLTGNYGFFNLQAAVLCVLLIDDRTWLWLGSLAGWQPMAMEAAGPVWPLWVVAVPALLLGGYSLWVVACTLRPDRRPPRWLGPVHAVMDRLRLVNAYGLFANMTTSRTEIVVEGSEDGATWRPYRFRWKPGDPRDAPRRAAPHQPRLDWQMWFAALDGPRATRWLVQLLEQLLAGSPQVTGLFRENPFPGEPPRYVRAVLYEYRFSGWREGWRRNVWWERRRVGLYCPVLSVRGEVRGLGSV